tara:strand:+ start:223 stop:501 length:279 start_codon:yes stop_codon:yes gene_type:complete
MTPGAPGACSCRNEIHEKTGENKGVWEFEAQEGELLPGPGCWKRGTNPQKTGKNYGSYREFAHRAPGAQLPGSRFSNLEKFMYGEFGSLRGV